MNKVKEIFGSMVFDNSVMKEKLPKETYKIMQNTIQNGKRLDAEVANVVANAMKDWAIEKGATHFTHWFQPMTGITAEKHDSFISPDADGKVIMEFSGKELVKGEADASSFPSGGIRSTFEARGYTAWDPTSYAFIKDNTLYIPTAFCSYGGEAIDKKTPLLRSMEAINKQALRILKIFGNEDVTAVKTTVGPEQEYFLVDKETFDKRPDLIFTGRTLIGAKAPKGQELDDHYYGTIKPRIKAFMNDLDEELWKLGVLAKTEHNEAAPAQHELAPIFTTTNIAMDHNQLTMNLLQTVAAKHGLVCLLHEKPFAGVNGSGKHNNWSLSTNTGVNLFEPGETPYENAQFLLFMCAVIKAVDEYQDLLRISVASASNDHRLGANEAPPAVVSIFVGEELSAILDAIETDTPYDTKEKELLRIGVHVMPRFARDTTDRNRTSPFAFTGNKFEFRMLGSSASIAECNIMINTAVAEELKKFADVLENEKDYEPVLHDLIRTTIREHKRILFNGNGYDDEWIKEAQSRGLLNLKTTPEALVHFLDEKNVQLFADNKVFSEAEMHARSEIMFESYCKVINIEALTMLDMVKGSVIPAVRKYMKELADSAMSMAKFSPLADTTYESEVFAKLSAACAKAYDMTKGMEKALENIKTIKDGCGKAFAYKDIAEAMLGLRALVDEMETLTAKEYWPYPSYSELLFGVR
ncbi:MAG: glutamine synthetase III [Clostridia bacterium]|nr:glutamine synthetase III [Clostridia bacterium]